MNGELNDDVPKLTCKVCSKTREYTSSDMCAVNVGTPIADSYNLTEDDTVEQGFVPVCDTCYERAC